MARSGFRSFLSDQRIWFRHVEAGVKLRGQLDGLDGNHREVSAAASRRASTWTAARSGHASTASTPPRKAGVEVRGQASTAR